MEIGRRKIAGVLSRIVKDGTVLARGYGQRKLGEALPVDENTMFGIGSNTKAFTTAALATLVDEGRISWDDPVTIRRRAVLAFVMRRTMVLS